MKKFGTAIIIVTLGAGLAFFASAPGQAAEGRNAAAAIGFGAGAAVGAAAAGAASTSYAGPGYREVSGVTSIVLANAWLCGNASATKRVPFICETALRCNVAS
jgi:hypothetical protein